MSYLINPDQIKRREYLGLGTILTGVLALIAGIVCLLFSLAACLLLSGAGLSLGTAGLVILHRIPDVVGQPEELW